MTIKEQLANELLAWEAAGLKRHLTHSSGMDFTSNDYFGMSSHPEVIKAAKNAIDQTGLGSGAARLLRGNHPLHEEAEVNAAKWLGTEAALLLTSGYQANLALISSLATSNDLILSDEKNHASLIDGCRLSRAKVSVFPHQDLENLKDRLRQDKKKSRRRWIIVERVYSMDGDLTNIEHVLEIATTHDAYVLVDEAHAAGLFPPLQPHPRLCASVITGGKALGCAGAFIAANQSVIDWIVNKGRSFIFTTAPPPAIAAALTASIKVIKKTPQLGRLTLENASFLRSSLRKYEINTAGKSAIVPIILGDEKYTLHIAAVMQSIGFDIRAVRPPTVPQGTSRLRIVVHYNHSQEQLKKLAEKIAQSL